MNLSSIESKNMQPLKKSLTQVKCAWCGERFKVLKVENIMFHCEDCKANFYKSKKVN